MTSQYLTGRRIGELAEQQSQIATWAKHINEKQSGVAWQCKIDDARTKPMRRYAQLKIG